MFTRTRALQFTLSRPTPIGGLLSGAFKPNKEYDQPCENILRHYWGQWTEPRDVWAQGWQRPYQGDQQGYTQWRGGIAWGHYIPSHDPREEPTAYRRTWRDRITPHFRVDKRPHLLSLKYFTNVNQHNLWRDKRDSAWKGWYYHFNIPMEPKNFRPNLWLQSNYIMTQDNWKPITDSEAKANQERQEIAGRNRRYFWKLKFHPINGKFFTDKGTDAQWVRVMRARHEVNALWGEDQHARREWGWNMKYFIIPLFISLYFIQENENNAENCRTRSYLGKTPQIVYKHDGNRPTNWITGGVNEEKFTSWNDLIFGDGIRGLTSAITLWMFDDFRKTQIYQYKQYTKYAEAAGIAGFEKNEDFYGENMLHDPMREALKVTHGRDTLPRPEHNGVTGNGIGLGNGE